MSEEQEGATPQGQGTAPGTMKIPKGKAAVAEAPASKVRSLHQKRTQQAEESARKNGRNIVFQVIGQKPPTFSKDASGALRVHGSSGSKSIRLEGRVFIPLKDEELKAIADRMGEEWSWVTKIPETHRGDQIIRYARGETSIFAKDHLKTATGEYAEEAGYVAFVNATRPFNTKRQVNEVRVLRCLELCQDSPFAYSGKTPVYFERNNEKEAKARTAVQKRMSEVNSLIWRTDFATIEGLALIYGVSLDHEEEVVRQMLVEAATDADEFMKWFDAPQTEKVKVLLEAESEDLVRLDGNNLVYKNGTYITSIPLGKTKREHYLSFVDTDEGQLAYRALNDALSRL